MRLYNQNIDKIENYKDGQSIQVAPNEYKVISHLTEAQRNSYGFFNIEYGARPNALYYTSTESGAIVGNVYQVAYTPIELPLQQAKDNVCNAIDNSTKETITTMAGSNDKQRNYLAKYNELLEKKIDGIVLTLDEQTLLTTLKDLWLNIETLVNDGNAREAQVQALTTFAEVEAFTI